MHGESRYSTSGGRRCVLVIIALPDASLSALSRRYDVCYRPNGWKSVEAQECMTVEAVVTNGTTGLTAEWMKSLPGLHLICAFGAGHENVDIEAARARNIAVANAPGTNDSTVADHALALALAIARDIPRRDRAIRQGHWASSRSPRPTLSGATVGLLGLGRIGRAIATRAGAFGAHILYHTPIPKRDCEWRYVANVVALAEQSRFLIVACPGGSKTFHLVDDRVLRALGPDGFLINIARGSVVDTKALIAALSNDAIGGAALDVVEGEPDIPAELLVLDNVICTPHMAGRSPDSENAQTELMMANLNAFFSGRPLLTPILAASVTVQ